ncbi:Pantoate-beta-alanine ligase [Mycena latifolia]|nr:Pantoate-beta-alanine ligase [Mycena latifolia]
MTTTAPALPPSSIPLFTTVAAFRQLRPDDGALHDGHMSLVQRSLAENDFTVLSIFVNPAQFAPHEDLATYPRTLPHDLGARRAGQRRRGRAHRVRGVPARGTFVEVKGYGDQMEGKSRPDILPRRRDRGHQTLQRYRAHERVLRAKDIQQCLVLKRLCRDLLLSHPDPRAPPHRPHRERPRRQPRAHPRATRTSARRGASSRRRCTARSRAAEAAWNDGHPKSVCLERATEVVNAAAAASASAPGEHPELRLDYIEFNDSDSLEALDGAAARVIEGDAKPVILSGALWMMVFRLHIRVGL